MGLRRDLGGSFDAASVVLALVACSDAHGNAPAQEPVMDASGTRDAGRDAATRVKERLVTIELLKTAERVLEMGADGELVYGPLIDIGGVEVCVVQRRAAFASFTPFADMERPICETSVEGEKVTLNGLPANSDLIITTNKAGYMPGSATFRTDEFDVDVPTMWGPTAVTAMVREGALEPWLEPGASADGPEGIAVVLANVVWIPVWIPAGFTDAEGVTVEIEREGRPVTALSTLRERWRFVPLPAALYSMRFSHPRMNARPFGVEEQYLVFGLGTDREDTIELPVLAGHFTAGVGQMFCAARDWNQTVEDLATCTLSPADAGSP
jgi:hypothetical protein